jgi:hypothetical protein
MQPEKVVADYLRASRIKTETERLAKEYGIRAEGLTPDDIYENAMRIIAPKDMETVRSFPSELHSPGIEYLIETLDRSVEDRESGYCADWHIEESAKYVADIVKDTSVRTANDIVAWLDRRGRATQLHLA